MYEKKENLKVGNDGLIFPMHLHYAYKFTYTHTSTHTVTHRIGLKVALAQI